jgi:hypothetical protein
VRGGFSLAEVLIAILCLGLLLAPFLRTITSLPAMQRHLGLQARDEAWRSFQDHALAAGLDPRQAAALLAATNPAIPEVESEFVERGASVVPEGRVALRVLRGSVGAQHPEDRPGGSGWELSRGSALAPPAPPAPPLLPVTMRSPDITPLPGSSIPLIGLAPAEGSLPPSLSVEASSQENGRVCLKLGRAGTPSSGLGEAQGVVSVEEFAAGFIGTSWTEYPGEPAAGHRPVEMPDGRKRWLVPEGRGLRTYEPSEFVTWAYTLDLGPPILRHAGAEIADGGNLVLGYPDLAAVRSGEAALRIDWPDTTKALLGGFADRLAQGFEVTFAGNPGPTNGDLSLFCSNTALDAWTEESPLLATPLPAPGCTARSAAWTLGRGLTEMGEPERVNAGASESDPFPSGSAEFSPPAQADGVRRGRLSARDGTLVSTTPSLSLTIVP